jgi:GntR family transcriptional regulator/MocR family aminotransferase
MEFPLTIDKDNQEPLFIQLSKALKERIVAGTLPAGAALPPTRELANALGIARGTVVKAYEDLIAQGYLESLTGSSTFVSKRGQFERDFQTDIVQKRSQPQSAPPRISRDAAKLMQMSLSTGLAGNLKDLNYGAPPSDELPMNQWKEILTKQYRQLLPHHFDAAPETLGQYKLRVEIASYLARTKGLNCQPEQVIVFQGAQQALTYIARILIDSGDKVIVENPGYGGARDSLTDRGATLLPIDIDADGIRVDLFESEAAKLAYVTPSYHDPTGTILSLERRKKLLDWAARNESYIIEDAWDSDFSYINPPLPALQGLDRDERVIYVYSFWKLLYPLTTAGCAIVPPSLVPVFERVKFLSERQFPILEHYALAEFLRTGALALHVKKTKPHYEKRRKALTGALFTLFKTEIEVPRQSAGLHLCIGISQRLMDRGFETAAAQAGLPLSSTAPYYVSGAPSNQFLVPFASYSAEELERRIGLIAAMAR